MSTRSTSLRTLAAGVVAAALLGGCALTDGPAGGVTPTTAPTPEPSAHDEAAATADDADTGTPTDGPTTEEPTAPTADDGTTSPTGTAADGTGEDDGRAVTPWSGMLPGDAGHQAHGGVGRKGPAPPRAR